MKNGGCAFFRMKDELSVQRALDSHGKTPAGSKWLLKIEPHVSSHPRPNAATLDQRARLPQQPSLSRTHNVKQQEQAGPPQHIVPSRFEPLAQLAEPSVDREEKAKQVMRFVKVLFCDTPALLSSRVRVLAQRAEFGTNQRKNVVREFRKLQIANNIHPQRNVQSQGPPPDQEELLIRAVDKPEPLAFTLNDGQKTSATDELKGGLQSKALKARRKKNRPTQPPAQEVVDIDSNEPLNSQDEPSLESDSLAKISPLFQVDSTAPSSGEIIIARSVEVQQTKRKEREGAGGMDSDAPATEIERKCQIDSTHSIVRGVRKVDGKAVEEKLRRDNRRLIDVPAQGQCGKHSTMLGIGMNEDCLPSFMQTNLDFLRHNDPLIRRALHLRVAITNMDKTMKKLVEMFQKQNAWTDFEGLQIISWACNAIIHINCMADGSELALLEPDRDWGPPFTHPCKEVYLYLRRDKATPIYGLDYKPLPNSRGDGQAMADGHYKVALTFDEAAKVEEARRSRQGNGWGWPDSRRSPP